MPDHPSETPPAAPAISVDLFCPHCAYNLRGLTGNRCPECGESIDDLRDPVSRIPWVHRKQLGWWRAYWKTVSFVMFKQKQFANEMARPVSYRDAQAFRWVTVAGTVLPFVVAVVLLSVLSTSFVSLPNATPVAPWVWALVWMMLLVFVVGGTGIPTYLFHPRCLPMPSQNRAIALSCYACAAMSGMPIVGFAFAAGLILTEAEWPMLSTAAFLLSALTLPAVVFGWWVNLFRLARRITGPARYNAWRVGTLVPVGWSVWFVCCFAVIPALAYFIAVVFMTV